MKTFKRVIIISAVGAVLIGGAAAAAMGFADYVPLSEPVIVLGYELDNLPIEKLAERDGVDSEGMQYGLISTGGNALIHYEGHYNAREGKFIPSLDSSGEPRISGDYLVLDDAEIVLEDGSRASKRDLKPGTPVLIKYGSVREIYPAHIHCTKIVILKNEAVAENSLQTAVSSVQPTESLKDYSWDGDTSDEVITAYDLDYDRDDLPEPLSFTRYDEQKAKYAGSLPQEYGEEIPDEMLYGIMTDIDDIMISHATYYNTKENKTDIYTDYEGNRHISVDSLDTSGAEIAFEDGSPASENDLAPGTAVLVKYDMLYETYPGRMHCTKIVILK